MGNPNEDRTTLRDLSLPVRLTIAAFLMSVGLGYIAAMVQLKMQLASAGKFPPTKEDVISAYHGGLGKSQFQRLLEGSDTQPFNGQGSMRAAFTKKRSGGWAGAVKEKAKELELDRKDPANQKILDDKVTQDRDGERLALIEWLVQGASREEYEADAHPLSEELANRPITVDRVGEVGTKKVAKIRSIITDRCERCHGGGAGFGAAQYPLTTWEQIEPYVEKEKGTGMSLPKLAQTSHVHLLGFSMLWGLTGLIFAFSSYPGWIRIIVAPMAVLAQIVDISFWWLSRLEQHGPIFAQAITVSGGVVGLALGIQIVGSLFNLFGKAGKVVLVLVMLAGIAGGGLLYKNVVDPYLKSEEPATMMTSK